MTLVETAASLRARQFEELLDQGVSAAGYYLPEWHLALERSAPGQRRPYHVLVEDGANLVAAALCYIVRECPKLSLYTEQFHHGSPPWPPGAPVFQCQSSYAPVSTVLRRHADDVASLETVVNTMEQAASSYGCGGVLFMNVEIGDTHLRAVLRRRGYLSTYVNCNSVLSLPHRTFDDYLASRSKKFRHNVRYYARRAENNGIRIMQADPASVDLHRHEWLIGQPCLRHAEGGLHYPKTYLATILQSLSPYLDIATVVTPDQGAVSVGWTLIYKGAANAWIGGVDYACLKSLEPQHLRYSFTIRDCIERGVTQIHFGRGTFSMKVHYGCDFIPLYLFVKPLGRVTGDPVGEWVNAIRRWAVDYHFRELGTPPPHPLEG